MSMPSPLQYPEMLAEDTSPLSSALRLRPPLLRALSSPFRCWWCAASGPTRWCQRCRSLWRPTWARSETKGEGACMFFLCIFHRFSLYCLLLASPISPPPPHMAPLPSRQVCRASAVQPACLLCRLDPRHTAHLRTLGRLRPHGGSAAVCRWAKCVLQQREMPPRLVVAFP